ncbi:MAG: DUF192 domain-containing protein [bacterium]|nr:DUF192 domain-containing protein [bacterium]
MTAQLKKSIILGAAIFLLAAGCARQQPPETLPSAKVTIRNKIIAVEVAGTEQVRQLGLSGREDLKRGEGMLFVFELPDYHVFWMKNMNFPLDIVWIGGGNIVDIKSNLAAEGENPANFYRPARPADYALELNGGEVGEYGWEIGDKVEIKLP